MFFIQNAYEESITEESSSDEEENARQVRMATSAVALQLHARNSAGELIHYTIPFDLANNHLNLKLFLRTNSAFLH